MAKFAFDKDSTFERAPKSHNAFICMRWLPELQETLRPHIWRVYPSILAALTRKYPLPWFLRCDSRLLRNIELKNHGKENGHDNVMKGSKHVDNRMCHITQCI